jgi:hypothetical protein
MLNEQQISQAEPAFLRFNEAKYLYHQFITHCGPPADSYFHMIAYFDSFLFCLISIEEMVPDGKRNILHLKDVFRFLKAARNVTTHHSILAAPPGAQTVGFQRPFGRVISSSLGGTQLNDSARLKINLDVFRRVFDTAAVKYSRAKRSFEAGQDYLTRKESEGQTEIFIEEVMNEGIQAVAQALGYEP